MKWVLIILLLIPKPKPGCIQLDIIIVVDISGSVSGYERFLNSAVTSFIDGLDIADDKIHAGIISFSDRAKVECPLTGDHDQFDDSFDGFNSDNSSTDMREALMLSQDQFAKHGRVNVPKLVIIISDGAVINPGETLAIAQNVTAVLCGVLILNEVSNEDFMKSITKDCYLQSDYQGLIKKLDEMNICL